MEILLYDRLYITSGLMNAIKTTRPTTSVERILGSEILSLTGIIT